MYYYTDEEEDDEDQREEKCGIYLKNTILENVEIIFEGNQDEFLIINKELSDEDRDFMQIVPDIILREDHKMYSSNPYHSDLGLVKLYQDPRTKKVHRCKIEDLHCFRYINSLHLTSVITLIDLGKRFSRVDYEHIYDFSQRTSHLESIRPEAIRARLANISPRCKAVAYTELRKRLKRRNGATKIISVKILDYESDFYLVDILEDIKTSFLSELFDKMLVIEEKDNLRDAQFNSNSATARAITNSNSKDKDQSNEEWPQALEVVRFRSDRRRNRKPMQSTNDRSKPRKSRVFIGAKQYFIQELLKSIGQGNAYLNKRLFKVMILDWYDPDQIIVVPYYEDLSHPTFMARYNELKCVREVPNMEEPKGRLYKPGEFVFYLNELEDNALGPWLRGVIVSMSCFDDNSLVTAQRPTEEGKMQNYQRVQRLIKEGKLEAEMMVYRIRSLDYGCESYSSSLCMRPVNNLAEFKSLGTWSIRCKLFGVHPFKTDEGQFDTDCMDSVDSWIRERLYKDGYGFRILFRSKVLYNDFDYQYEITLLYRREPPYATFSSLLKPRLAEYECLNWHLVDLGFASHIDGRDSDSHIQLEDHVISRLAAHEKI